MKKALIIAFVGLFSLNVFAQAKEETKKERRAREWQIEKSELLELAKDSSFVLNAHTHYNRYQAQRPLTANNFIAVAGERIVIQTSNPYAVGYNGMGGLTLEGDISKYEIIEGKAKHAPKVRINFTNSVVGHGTLYVTLGGKDNTTAQLTDNWGRRNTWKGQVMKPENVVNFEGMSYR